MYPATIFLSAFLLFLVQPILAKQILPWFGGAASVWTLCMVFFQLVLLLGYAYAHWLALAATASAMLLGVTNHLSHNIASIPLLWVVPLAIYLLDPQGETVSDWILLTRNKAFLAHPLIAAATEPVAPRPDLRVWTDDFNNLVQVFRW